MDITEVTVVHHAALVLAALWAAASAGWAHPALFIVALLYIFAVSAHAPPTAHPPARPESPSRSPWIDCFAALIASCREPGELVNSAASLLTTTFGSLISGLLLLNYIFAGFYSSLFSTHPHCYAHAWFELDRFTNRIDS